MSLSGFVRDGTDAGRKPPFNGRASRWMHLCRLAPLPGDGRVPGPVILAGYRASCECGVKRPS